MLYIFYGGDTHKARTKANELIKALREKKPEAGFFRFESNNINSDEMEHLTAARGLFENNYIVLLDNILEERDNAELLKNYASYIKEAEHIFILLESDAGADSIKKIEKQADSVKYFKEAGAGVKEKNKEQFNIFDMADALGKRDRKKLWIMLQEARGYEVSPEEMFGILFWQIKNILLVRSANTAEEVGMKPFPFKKAKSFSKNFTTEELERLASELLYKYHQSRAGAGEADIELERFILNI